MLIQRSARRSARRLSEAPALRLVRVTVEDKLGAVENPRGQSAPPSAQILSLHAHPNFRGQRNEPDVSTPDQANASNRVAPARPTGTIDVRSLPTTALSYRKTLALVTPVAENPREHLCEIPDVAEIDDRPGLSEAAFQPGTGPRPSHHQTSIALVSPFIALQRDRQLTRRLKFGR